MSLGGIIGTALIYGLNLLHAYNILPDVVQNPDITGEDKKATLRFEMRPYADARRIENQYVLCYSVYF